MVSSARLRRGPGISSYARVEADATNKPIWARDVELFAIEGWLDPGELAATLYVADLTRERPILDLGVGAGRTVSLLRLISSDYRAIDYVPEMVEACRRRHPGVDVRQADARELNGITDGSCGLVTFSSNGIDAVDRAGREAILISVRRVLEPGGIFFFSTLNKDSELFGARPGTAPELTWVPGSLLPVGPGAAAAAADEHRWARAVRNWRGLRQATEDHGEWGMAPFAAHEFGLLTHFVTIAGLRAELNANGFDVLKLFACEDGSVIVEETSQTLYVHVVARRR